MLLASVGIRANLALTEKTCWKLDNSHMVCYLPIMLSSSHGQAMKALFACIFFEISIRDEHILKIIQTSCILEQSWDSFIFVLLLRISDDIRLSRVYRILLRSLMCPRSLKECLWPAPVALATFMLRLWRGFGKLNHQKIQLKLFVLFGTPLLKPACGCLGLPTLCEAGPEVVPSQSRHGLLAGH